MCPEEAQALDQADDSGRLTVRRSKTDQDGDGAVLYLGPPKPSPRSAHGSPARGSPRGHSLRVGSAQSLVAAGADLPALMQAGRWQDSATAAGVTPPANSQAAERSPSSSTASVSRAGPRRGERAGSASAGRGSTPPDRGTGPYSRPRTVPKPGCR